MTEPVRWGVLSTANINRKLLAGARLSDQVDVVAVASRDADRARDYADANAIPRAYGSYDDLLGDPDVDAVYVPLPNSLHHPWTLRALLAGKHVLCEKPYTADLAQVREAFDLADERGLVLSEAYMYRYHPQTRLVRDLVGDGAVGELAIISGSFTWPCVEPDVRLDPQLQGGCLLDVGCYPLSATRMLAGEPLSVAAQQVVGPTGVDVRFTGLLQLADGVLGHLDAGFGVPDRSTFEVLGTRGRIRVQDPWHCATPGVLLEREGHDPEQLLVPEGNSYMLELEAVGAAIRGDAGGTLGRQDATGQAAALAALLQAARTGEPVTPVRG
jgi:D-xylose 1-dehydrogenase (NADP+, D-xylono-1,5-lactone-forming)